MKRSEINQAKAAATAYFNRNGWTLPPNPVWDITDFGLGNFPKSGLLLINLAEEAEYCEKLMYARRNQVTPAHYHKKKKEDIICRTGQLIIELWEKDPATDPPVARLSVKVNGQFRTVQTDEPLVLNAGERVTITPLLWHAFYPGSEECIIGEVSTANDDHNDNFFSNPDIGRFSEIVED
ncbi:MAG: D-lyxose/D-mannose family sugar isomerase [Candidatus Pseudobacter hemicellulosilyticus]|uniref:D-lyxose ketol-isomerase n=1 Tax=Candidatus Pseudobacter hemicellulosilyticus TaxID=3121375 RepID=A0AAJ6BI90_9BACT|nr:MAG: D-lyxose/D-mannose family sugar isomerase [Pseudobacter sp.]